MATALTVRKYLQEVPASTDNFSFLDSLFYTVYLSLVEVQKQSRLRNRAPQVGSEKAFLRQKRTSKLCFKTMSLIRFFPLGQGRKSPCSPRFWGCYHCGWRAAFRSHRLRENSPNRSMRRLRVIPTLPLSSRTHRHSWRIDSSSTRSSCSSSEDTRSSTPSSTRASGPLDKIFATDKENTSSSPATGSSILHERPRTMSIYQLLT